MHLQELIYFYLEKSNKTINLINPEAETIIPIKSPTKINPQHNAQVENPQLESILNREEFPTKCSTGQKN
jgi:hypothetical protein